MTHALQVSFRRVLPSEKVVALASRRFLELKRARPEFGECWVVVEAVAERVPPQVRVVVTVQGVLGAEAGERHATHRDPEVALAHAFAALSLDLGAFPAHDDPVWTRPPSARLARAAGSR